MEVKTDPNQFDVSKICRTCLTEKEEMRSVFLADESIGQTVQLAEMIMGFSNLQIETGDGLPDLICLQCIHQVNRAYSFKQQCEQSDSNLRQYLGKPLGTTKNVKPEETTQQGNDYYSSSMLIDSLGLSDSSDNSDDDDSFTKEFGMIEPIDPADEKAIAHRQLLKTAKAQKSKMNKKKLLAKSGKTGSPGKKQKRNTNQCNVCRKQFINLKSFRKHLRTHIEDRPFKCKLCPRAFTEENYLNNHMRTHIPDEQKPHVCDVCGKRFIHETLLTKHALKHTGEKPFVCKICNKGCYAENSLLKHMKIHEKKEGDPALLKHICDYCKSEFPDAATLDVHIKQHTEQSLDVKPCTSLLLTKNPVNPVKIVRVKAFAAELKVLQPKPRRPLDLGYLSLAEKQSILNLYLSITGSHPRMKMFEVMSKIVDAVGVTKSTVYRVIKEYKQTGTISEPKHIGGRPSIVKTCDDVIKKSIHEITQHLLLTNQTPSLDKVLNLFNCQPGVPKISRSTLYNLMKEMKNENLTKKEPQS